MLDRFERFSLAIFEITRYWHKLTSDEMEKYGLKGPHSVYLLALYRFEEGLTSPQICEICSKDKSDVSRMMSIMEEKGLVIKEGKHQNMYGGVFKLTDEGKKAAQFVSGRAATAVSLAGKDLTEENRAIFYDALESISANLKHLSIEGIPE